MTTFQTILMLLLMAGLIVCHEAIKKTIPLNKKGAIRVLQQLDSQTVEEVHEYIMFRYQDATFWLNLRNTPIVTLAATTSIAKNPDIDAAKKAAQDMNSVTSGVYVLLDDDYDVHFLCNFFAPSRYILRKTLPLAIQHISNANLAFWDAYLLNCKKS